jgi:hypothetical protein
MIIDYLWIPACAGMTVFTTPLLSRLWIRFTRNERGNIEYPTRNFEEK